MGKSPRVCVCGEDMPNDKGAKTIMDGNVERITRFRVCPSCGAEMIEHQTTTIIVYYPESHSLPVPFPDHPGEGRMSPDTP